MVTKAMRQSSRNAMDIDRKFGRTSRAYKITPVRWVKKRSRWEKLVDWFKKLIGR